MTTTDLTTLEETLFELERQFWLRAGDVDFYAEELTDDAAMVFPAPFGVLDRDAVLDAIGSSANWTSVTMEERRLVALTDASAAVAYRATGVRADARYTTYAASVYVRRGGAWKLALHQQTPVAEDAA